MIGRFKVGFCVSGGGRLAKSAITVADKLGIQPSLIVADYTAAADLEGFCSAHAVDCIRLPKLARKDFDRELHRICTQDEHDLWVLTFDRIIAGPLVRHYERRMINVHPALLPAFVGTKPLQRTVDAGVRFGGATIHEVIEEVDAGPVISQCVLALRRREEAAQYGARLFEILRPMFLQTLQWYAEGRVGRDAEGRIWVADATYGEWPVCPSLEGIIR